MKIFTSTLKLSYDAADYKIITKKKSRNTSVKLILISYRFRRWQ